MIYLCIYLAVGLLVLCWPDEGHAEDESGVLLDAAPLTPREEP